MSKAIAVAIVVFFASSSAIGGGLSASIGKCAVKQDMTLNSIGSDIVLSVVKTLLGGLIDGAVDALSKDKVETFDVIIPVDDIKPLVGDGTDCLFVSSIALTPTKLAIGKGEIFSVQVRFLAASDKSALRPIIVSWHYGEYLAGPCPWYLSCNRRDVAIALEMLAPTSKVSASTVGAEPIGIFIENAKVSDLNTALRTGDSLPWFVPSPKSGPVNLRFRIVETMEPWAFSKALASALKAQKENILTTVDNKLKGISDQVAAEAAQKDVSAATAAFANYKTAWEAAVVTKEAHAKATTPDQKNLLALRYALEIKAVYLTEVLAKSAFDVAKVSWPGDGLGSLPSSL